MWFAVQEHLGLARIIHIQCIYGVFGRKITKHTVHMYGSGLPWEHCTCTWAQLSQIATVPCRRNARSRGSEWCILAQRFCKVSGMNEWAACKLAHTRTHHADGTLATKNTKVGMTGWMNGQHVCWLTHARTTQTAHSRQKNTKVGMVNGKDIGSDHHNEKATQSVRYLSKLTPTC
jgi:hypothetical protein